MPTRFAAREARVSASIDREHGEITRVLPRAASAYLAGHADGTRAILDIIGIIDTKPVIGRIKDRAEYDAHRPEVSGDTIHVSYTKTRFTDPAQWPRKGDHIQAIERSGTPKYQVTDVDDDGIGRIVCKCVVAK
jgi:hypothetical protein